MITPRLIYHTGVPRDLLLLIVALNHYSWKLETLTDGKNSYVFDNSGYLRNYVNSDLASFTGTHILELPPGDYYR